MSKTPIEWTDETWNPTRGCSPVSPGCKNCYAERIAGRFSQGFGDSHKKQGSFAGFAVLTDKGPKWTGKVELVESKLFEPLHWRKPRRVFVDSMSDLFHENLPTREIMRVFSVMALTPWITYQVLTKRAKRLPLVIDKLFELDVKGCAWEMLGHFPKFNHNYMGSNVLSRPWPLQNVWLGVSVENQTTAEQRIPELLSTPAALRFCSYEPALGPVNFLKLSVGPDLDLCGLTGWRTGSVGKVATKVTIPPEHRGLDWGIVGGESGPGARPFDLEWGRDTIRQFKAALVPLFVKQLGSCPVGPMDLTYLSGKGGNWDDWPSDLRVRQFPNAPSHFANRAG